MSIFTLINHDQVARKQQLLEVIWHFFLKIGLASHDVKHSRITLIKKKAGIITKVCYHITPFTSMEVTGMSSNKCYTISHTASTTFLHQPTKRKEKRNMTC